MFNAFRRNGDKKKKQKTKQTDTDLECGMNGSDSDGTDSEAANEPESRKKNKSSESNSFSIRKWFSPRLPAQTKKQRSIGTSTAELNEIVSTAVASNQMASRTSLPPTSSPSSTVASPPSTMTVSATSPTTTSSSATTTTTSSTSSTTTSSIRPTVSSSAPSTTTSIPLSTTTSPPLVTMTPSSPSETSVRPSNKSRTSLPTTSPQPSSLAPPTKVVKKKIPPPEPLCPIKTIPTSTSRYPITLIRPKINSFCCNLEEELDRLAALNGVEPNVDLSDPTKKKSVVMPDCPSPTMTIKEFFEGPSPRFRNYDTMFEKRAAVQKELLAKTTNASNAALGQKDSTKTVPSSNASPVQKESVSKISNQPNTVSTTAATARTRGRDVIETTIGTCSTIVEEDEPLSPPKVVCAKHLSKAVATEMSSMEKTAQPKKYMECSLCLAELPIDHFPKLISCQHRPCIDCLRHYLEVEISESRVHVTCPECTEILHPNDIKMLINDPSLYLKYEERIVRRALAVDPDTRWCPAPDCGYAVIASGCASCPKLRCKRPGCGRLFCYHCKQIWHPNTTCEMALMNRLNEFRHHARKEDIKCCPICRVLIVKMDDGSCNHMTCAVCGAEFCWLCMNVVGDLHYLSPSGCTFWGKKPWSRKKKILWQLGILVGAPVGIALIAGIAIPAIIIGVPIWTGRKLYTRFMYTKPTRRNLAIAMGVLTAILAAPILATLAVAIGVPILLFYVYGVVPVSLCRSSGCGVSTTQSGAVRFDFDDPAYNEAYGMNGGGNGIGRQNALAASVSRRLGLSTSSPPEDEDVTGEANPSIGEASLSLDSGSHLERDMDESSVAGMAGSLLAHRLEATSDSSTVQNGSVSSETASDRSDIATSSTRGLNGSVSSYKQTDTISNHSYRVGSADGVSSGEQNGDGNLSLGSLEEVTASLIQSLYSMQRSKDGKKSSSSKSDLSAMEAGASKTPSRVSRLRNLYYNLMSTSPAVPVNRHQQPTTSKNASLTPAHIRAMASRQMLRRMRQDDERSRANGAGTSNDSEA